jgi:hypothetical protein
MTNEQTEELIKELQRLNDILLNMAQVQAIQVVNRQTPVKGFQELPKIRKTTS